MSMDMLVLSWILLPVLLLVPSWQPSLLLFLHSSMLIMKVNGFTVVHSQGENKILGQPSYQIASQDLSKEWIKLVQEGKVVATVNLEMEDGQQTLKVPVQYGVKLSASGMRCEEFVQQVGLDQDEPSPYPRIEEIRLALYQMQKQQGEEEQAVPAVKFAMDGDFCAQLQLIRTLRPPPSPGFAGATSSIPPNYDTTTDSFVTGPLRLELRPRVALLQLSQNVLSTPWDAYHNVSPADTRGHFLLLPTLTMDHTKNWRSQVLTTSDCHDLVHLTASIHPIGSLFVAFNSVGAAASQNHIHCHAWPLPPVPFLTDATSRDDDDDDDDDAQQVNGWDCYAVSKVDTIYDFCDVIGNKDAMEVVEVSYLEYPVFCVRLSSRNYSLLGQVLATTIQSLGTAPYNIGFVNRPEQKEEVEQVVVVDVYVFVRSKERSTVIPSLKLGISEMMGVFHAQSDAEMEQLVAQTAADTSGADNDEPIMAQALNDISYESEEVLWETIKTKLMAQHGES